LASESRESLGDRRTRKYLVRQSLAPLSSEVDAYTGIRLQMHMELGRIYGVENVSRGE